MFAVALPLLSTPNTPMSPSLPTEFLGAPPLATSSFVKMYGVVNSSYLEVDVLYLKIPHLVAELSNHTVPFAGAGLGATC